VRLTVDAVGGRTLAAAAAMLVAYGLWQVFRWGGRGHQELIGDLAFFPVNGAGAVCAWFVSRRTDLGRSTCLAWRLLSVALWLYLLGDALQAVYEVRMLLDMGTVFIGGATFLWYVALGPAVAARPSFDLTELVIFAYPIGDLLLLFGALSVLWRGAPRSSVTPLRIFATGMLVFIVADVTYNYTTIHSTYLGGDPVDTLWVLALTILFVAAASQLRAGPAAGFAAVPRPFAARPSVLPYLAVAASYVLLILVGLHDVPFYALGGLLLGAVALTVLVSARQFATLRDYGQLAVRYQQLASIDGGSASR